MTGPGGRWDFLYFVPVTPISLGRQVGGAGHWIYFEEALP